MAQYKVPQDVEAEDKLIAWLSFRQFIYLGIAVGAAAMAFFLAQVSIVLIIIPLPVIALFGTLALPIRKDQPLETYLLAVARFYLKPKVRRWDPDGTISYVEITAPKLLEPKLAKEYSGEAAKERLDYLARIMDSRGWAYKGVPTTTNESVNATVAAEATAAKDVLDENAELSRSFTDLIARKTQQQKEDAISRMRLAQSQPAAEPTPTINYNPYPSSMHQKVIQPMGEEKHSTPVAVPKPVQKPAAPAMTQPVAPGIISLASNKNLTVSALAREANRLETKNGSEVVIKLH